MAQSVGIRRTLSSLLLLYTSIVYSGGILAGDPPYEEAEAYLRDQQRVGRYFDRSKEFPNLFLPYEVRPLARKTDRTQQEQATLDEAISEAQKLTEAALASLFDRVTIGLVPPGERQARPIRLFPYLQAEIDKVNPNAELTPSAGLMRNAMNYLYREMHEGLLKQPPETPADTLRRIAAETGDLPITAVRGIKSDLDMYIRSLDGRAVGDLSGIENLVQNLTDSAGRAYAPNRKWGGVIDSLFERPDVKSYDQQTRRSVEQGGSTVDFLSFSRKKKNILSPSTHPHLAQQFIAGFFEYLKPAGDAETPLKQTARLGRAFMDTPWLELKDEAQVVKEMEAHQKASLLPNPQDLDKTNAQYAKLSRNTLHCGARNCLTRARPGSVLALYAQFSQKITKTPVPEYVDYRPLSATATDWGNGVPDSVLIPTERFIEKHTSEPDGSRRGGGYLFHGTPTLEAAFAMLRQGMYVSNDRQGMAVFGRGGYSSPDYSTALGYRGGGGVVMRLRLRSDLPLRILDWDQAQREQPEFVKRISKEAQEAGLLPFELLSREHGIDIILNHHVLIQNAAAVEYNDGLKGLADDLARNLRNELGNPKAKDSDLTAQVEEYVRIHTFFQDTGEDLRALLSPTDLAQALMARPLNADTRMQLLREQWFTKVAVGLPRFDSFVAEVVPSLVGEAATGKVMPDRMFHKVWQYRVSVDAIQSAGHSVASLPSEAELKKQLTLAWLDSDKPIPLKARLDLVTTDWFLEEAVKHAEKWESFQRALSDQQQKLLAWMPRDARRTGKLFSGLRPMVRGLYNQVFRRASELKEHPAYFTYEPSRLLSQQRAFLSALRKLGASTELALPEVRFLEAYLVHPSTNFRFDQPVSDLKEGLKKMPDAEAYKAWVRQSMPRAALDENSSWMLDLDDAKDIEMLRAHPQVLESFGERLFEEKPMWFVKTFCRGGTCPRFENWQKRFSKDSPLKVILDSWLARDLTADDHVLLEFLVEQRHRGALAWMMKNDRVAEVLLDRLERHPAVLTEMIAGHPGWRLPELVPAQVAKRIALRPGLIAKVLEEGPRVLEAVRKANYDRYSFTRVSDERPYDEDVYLQLLHRLKTEHPEDQLASLREWASRDYQDTSAPVLNRLASEFAAYSLMDLDGVEQRRDRNKVLLRVLFEDGDYDPNWELHRYKSASDYEKKQMVEKAAEAAKKGERGKLAFLIRAIPGDPRLDGLLLSLQNGPERQYIMRYFVNHENSFLNTQINQELKSRETTPERLAELLMEGHVQRVGIFPERFSDLSDRIADFTPSARERFLAPLLTAVKNRQQVNQGGILEVLSLALGEDSARRFDAVALHLLDSPFTYTLRDFYRQHPPNLAMATELLNRSDKRYSTAMSILTDIQKPPDGYADLLLERLGQAQEQSSQWQKDSLEYIEKRLRKMDARIARHPDVPADFRPYPPTDPSDFSAERINEMRSHMFFQEGFLRKYDRNKLPPPADDDFTEGYSNEFLMRSVDDDEVHRLMVLLKGLPPITEAQREYALKRALDPVAPYKDRRRWMHVLRTFPPTTQESFDRTWARYVREVALQPSVSDQRSNRLTLGNMELGEGLLDSRDKPSILARDLVELEILTAHPRLSENQSHLIEWLKSDRHAVRDAAFRLLLRVGLAGDNEALVAALEAWGRLPESDAQRPVFLETARQSLIKTNGHFPDADPRGRVAVVATAAGVLEAHEKAMKAEAERRTGIHGAIESRSMEAIAGRLGQESALCSRALEALARKPKK